ncbi:hypothetical protein ABW19_dt0206453 [Dactylella cylindrospora]|nr:hypothetical protein ABW19_dt0206453 [Dactylella cylindrospora]
MSLKLRISDGINNRMEKLLTRVRSGSLRKRRSDRSVGQASVVDAQQSSIEDVRDDEFLLTPTQSKIYGSTSHVDGNRLSTDGESKSKPASRRSSLSRRGKKSSGQHVDFQSPLNAQEPLADNALSRSSSLTSKGSKKHRAHRMSSLVSLISNATSTKSQRSLRRQRSIADIRRITAQRAVDDNFPTSRPAYIAIGSSSLLMNVAERINELPKDQLQGITFVSTGVASEHLLAAHGLHPITTLSLLPPDQKIDVYFDTADEIDDSLNCIKGRNGNLHLERMVALRCRNFACIVDHHKRVPTLFTLGRSLAVEITPESYLHALKKLRDSGATATLRSGEPAIAGPCMTERGTYLVDTSWPALRDSAGEVEKLADSLKGVYGVVDHGLFYGSRNGQSSRPNRVYVGLEDGAVDVLGGGQMRE